MFWWVVLLHIWTSLFLSLTKLILFHIKKFLFCINNSVNRTFLETRVASNTFLLLGENSSSIFNAQNTTWAVLSTGSTSNTAVLNHKFLWCHFQLQFIKERLSTLLILRCKIKFITFNCLQKWSAFFWKVIKILLFNRFWIVALYMNVVTWILAGDVNCW